MSQIIAGWNWFLSQNLLTQALVSIGALNIIIAGLKQLGLTTLADFCQKLENAISAMLQASKTTFVSEMSKPKGV